MQHNLNLNDSTSDSGNIQKIISEMHNIILKPQKDFDTLTRLGSYRHYTRTINGFETVSIGEYVHPKGYDDGIIDINKVKLIGKRPKKQVKYIEIPEKPKYLTMVQRNQLEITNNTLVIREIFIRSSTYEQNVFRHEYTVVLRDLDLTNQMMTPGLVRISNIERFIFPPRPSLSPPRPRVSFDVSPTAARRIPFESQVGWLPGISSMLGPDVPVKIQGIVESLSSAMPRLHQNNDELLRILQKVNSMLCKENEESIKMYVRENIEKLQQNNDLHAVSDHALKGLSLVMFVSSAAFAYSTRSNEAYAALAASTIGVVYFYKENLTSLLPMFSKLAIQHVEPQSSTEVNMMEAQINFGEGDYISLIATTLIGMSISKQNSNHIPTAILKHIGDYSKIRDNLEKVCIFMMDLLGKVLDYAGCANMLPTDMRSFHITDKDVLHIIDKTAEIKNKQLERTFSFNDDNYEKLVDLIVKCDMLLLYYKGRDRCHAHIAVSNHRQVLSKIRDQFLDANYRVEGLRMEPVCFLLAGGPGTLKTSALYHISRAISPFILTDEEKESCHGDYDTYVYNRCVEQGYWDGFTSDKRICFFDDFGQIRDMVGNADNEYMNLIRAVNEFEFSPHMADIGGKGNVKFRCKAVLATSNSTNWGIESIIEINAVKRRFDKTYIVIPRDEYSAVIDSTSMMGRRVDIDKLPIGELGIPSVSPDILLFAEFDLIKQQNTGVILNFNQLINKIKSTYDVKVKRFEQKKLELKNRAFKSSLQYDKICLRKDEDEISEYFDAQVGFDLTKYKPLKPLYTLNEVSKERYPSYIPEDDEFGKITLDYLRFMYDALDIGDDSKISKFRATVLYMKSIRNIGMYHESIYLYLLIKIYGVHFLEMLDGPHSPVYIAESLPFSSDDFIDLLPGPVFQVTTLDRLQNAYNITKNKIRQFLSTPFRDSLEKVWQYYKEKRSIILEMFAALGFAWSLYRVLRQPVDVPTNEGQYGYSLRSSKARPVREISRKARHIVPHESQFNWGEDINGERLVEKIVKKNVYEIMWTSNDGSRKNKLGYVTFIVDTLGLVPKHFLNFLDMKIDDGESSYEDKIVLSRRNAGESHKKYVISVRDFMSNALSTTGMEENDICLVRFPRECGPHRNIVEHFPTSVQVNNMKDMKGKLYIPDSDWQQCKNVQVSKVKNQMVALAKDEMYSILNGYEYDAHTQKGDCGAILAIMDKRLQLAKIFGIHTAGRTANAVGFASAITRDMLEEVLTELDEDIVSEPMEKEAQSGKIISDGRYVELYETDKPVFSSGKTAIIPSALHSFWKPALLKPAILKPFVNKEGKKVDPMQNALLKYCSPGVYFPTEILKNIRDDYFDFLMRVSDKDVPRIVLTYEESILGIEHEPLFKSIARKTSPGYPWIKDRHGAKGKFHLFGNEDVYDLDTKDGIILRTAVENMISLASQGIRSSVIFSDNLKDETRPINKVDEGKTRLFSSCPIDYLLAFRMYFGSFSLWFMKNKIVNHSAIGVNPYSDEWHRIARMLLSKGHSDDSCVGAGDYSAFDGSEKSHIHWLIFDIANKWYNDGSNNSLIRKVLWCDLVKSKHINGNLVYQWDSSLPSGHAWTIMVNGMYNEIAFRYCWAKSQKFDRIMMSKFDEFVYVIFMGDDNAFSVSPSYRGTFNEMTIAEHMKDIGLDYTTEHKGKALVPLRKIHEIDFLKRAFKLDRNVLRYIAPLQLDVVLEIPYWTKNTDTRTITIDNCNTSIKELSLHGKEIFSKYIDKITEGMKLKCDAHPFTTSYSVAFETVLNSEFML